MVRHWVAAAMGVAALAFAGWVAVSGGSETGYDAYQGKAPWSVVEKAGE